MQYKWLNQNDNNKLILFFNGWGMNETPIKHLKFDDYDVLLIYDYRDFEINFKEFNFEKYSKKYLISWSMGVYVSNLYSDILNNFNKKVAINGTSKIIDNIFGIPEKIYKITIRLFNEESANKFIQNMFEGGIINPNIIIDRKIDDLKEELISIQNLNVEEKIEYDKAIISIQDKIIPTKNQLNYWQDKNIELEQITSTHCPFEKYNSFKDILC